MTSRAGTGPRVLVIDDEPQIRRLLSVSLSVKGYRVEGAATGAEGIETLAGDHFDVVLLDLGLTDMDGVDVCRQIRQWSQIPIVVVSVREDERDKVAALDAGADDFITKPFGINELLARIRANLRRTAVPADVPVYRIGPLTIDLARRRVTSGDEDIHLTPTEYELLHVLAQHLGRVVTHRQLLREIRGPAYEDETPLLRVHMVALRQKLDIPSGAPGYIATEPGVGYRLQD